jgi:hypothetical protein
VAPIRRGDVVNADPKAAAILKQNNLTFSGQPPDVNTPDACIPVNPQVSAQVQDSTL